VLPKQLGRPHHLFTIGLAAFNVENNWKFWIYLRSEVVVLLRRSKNRELQEDQTLGDQSRIFLVIPLVTRKL
jgi:hypothetical protein